MPKPARPPSRLPWYTQAWVAGLLVAACLIYLLTLAGDYFMTSAEAPLVPPPAATSAATAPEPTAPQTADATPTETVEPTPAPATQPAPKTTKPAQKTAPKPAPKKAAPIRVARRTPAKAPRPTAAQRARARERAVTRSIMRAARAYQDTPPSSGWSPLAPPSVLTTGWTAPVKNYRITARFGDHGNRWSRDHTGLDFAVPSGTPVVAVDSGVVISAGWKGAYGQQVAVRHNDGTVTSYSHLSSIGVRPGTIVARGQVVARSGATGNVTGPHLHLEVRPGGGSPTDPADALRRHGVNV